jgi:hypothetical protein
MGSGLGGATCGTALACWLALAGCISSQQEGPVEQPQGPAQRRPLPAIEGPKILVEVSGEHVRVDGKEVAVDSKELRRALSRPGWGPTQLVVRADALALDVTLAKVLTEAPYALVARVRLELGELELDLVTHLAEPRLKTRQTLVALLTATQGQLWSVDSKNGAFSGPEVWGVGLAASESTARESFTQLCGPSRCRVALDVAPTTPLRAALRSWKQLDPDGRSQLDLSLHGLLRGTEGAATTELEPPTAPGAPTQVRGSYSPSLVQAIVRSSFRHFRKCYEDGLGRNRELRGRVTARFVIGRDGMVSHVADGGSSMPDEQVQECILKAYYRLRFPPPAQGIVTVVYPIRLEPAEPD